MQQLAAAGERATMKAHEARVQTGLAAYERAQADGLCHDGAWECALEAMRALDAEPQPQ